MRLAATVDGSATAACSADPGAAAALQAAIRIQAAVDELRPAQAAAVCAGLLSYPAQTADPRLPGPVLVPGPVSERRVQQILVAAGGGPLRDAAAALGQRCGAAVRVDRLTELLERWVPHNLLDPAAAAIARRLLCDRAGLAARPQSTHAATIEALSSFARAAADLADDAGLIDEDALAAHAAEAGWGDRVDDLAEACGMKRVLGHLAVRDNRVAAAKAALLSLGRAAGPAEVAELTGHSESTMSLAFSTCASIVRAGPKLWTACQHKQQLGFAAAAAELADDAGLINEDDLVELAESHDFAGGIDDIVAGCRLVRVFGHVAAQDSITAATKAVLLNLARPATAAEVAQTIGRSADSAAAAFWVCASVVRTSRRRWCAHHDPAFGDVAAAAAELADDVGLIDEDALAAAAAAVGWGGTVEEFAQRCGYSRLSGHLALEATTKAAVKAVVLKLGGFATFAEIAAEAQITKGQATTALGSCASLRSGPHGRWSIDTTAAHNAKERRRNRASQQTLRRVIQLCADDAGLVDEDRLAAAAAHNQTTVADITRACALVRVRGRLATFDTTPAATKATMAELGGPTTVAEIARITDKTPKAVAHAFAETPSIVRVGRQRWRLDTPDGALGEFAAAAMGLRDDVGLINEEQLRCFAAAQGCSDRFDELAEMCGFARLSGRLAVDSTNRAACKAALLNLGRPASLREIAAATGLTNQQQLNALLEKADCLILVGGSKWVTEHDAGVFGEFAGALALCSDDVGLIDEKQLAALAAEHDSPMSLEDLIAACGLPRLSGRLAVADTPAAAAKAALLTLGRPATLAELQDITEHTYSAILNGCRRCESVERVTAGKRGAGGLLRAI